MEKKKGLLSLVAACFSPYSSYVEQDEVTENSSSAFLGEGTWEGEAFQTLTCSDEEMDTTSDEDCYRIKVNIQTMEESPLSNEQTVDMTFSCETEVDTYLSSLRNQGYALEVSSSVQKKEKEVDLEVVYETQEEAEEALRLFLENYHGSGIITALRNSQEDVVEKQIGTQAFSSFTEAFQVASSQEEDTDYHCVTTKIRSQNRTLPIEEMYGQPFLSRGEAERFLDVLRNKGYHTKKCYCSLFHPLEDPYSNLYRLSGTLIKKEYYIDMTETIKKYYYALKAHGTIVEHPSFACFPVEEGIKRRKRLRNKHPPFLPNQQNDEENPIRFWGDDQERDDLFPEESFPFPEILGQSGSAIYLVSHKKNYEEQKCLVEC